MKGSQFDSLFHRAQAAHKGDFGRVLVIAGSAGMAGAAALTAKGCLRSGAGLVRIATSAACVDTVAGFDPCCMTSALPCDPAGRISRQAWPRLEEMVAWADVIALGPGLGRSNDLEGLVRQGYSQWQNVMVIDADGLNALASADPVPAGGPRILTPHPGEYARLDAAVKASADATNQANATSASNASSPSPQTTAATPQAMAAHYQATVVLKGHATTIADQQRQFENPTGNPGMATGGSGDVLTGVIAALCAQGLAPLDAARGGAYVHGLAGDLAAEQLGQLSMIASDLLDFLPAAFERWRTQQD